MTQRSYMPVQLQHGTQCSEGNRSPPVCQTPSALQGSSCQALHHQQPPATPQSLLITSSTSLHHTYQVSEGVCIHHYVNKLATAVITCCQPLHLILPRSITKQCHNHIVICQVDLQKSAKEQGQLFSQGMCWTHTPEWASCRFQPHNYWHI